MTRTIEIAHKLWFLSLMALAKQFTDLVTWSLQTSREEPFAAAHVQKRCAYCGEEVKFSYFGNGISLRCPTCGRINLVSEATNVQYIPCRQGDHRCKSPATDRYPFDYDLNVVNHA